MHLGNQFFDDIVIVTIDLVIEPAHAPGQAGIEVDKRIQALAHHRGRQIGHALEFVGNRDVRRLRQLNGTFGNILRQVGHAFQFGVDLERGRDAAQIDGHRLMQSEDLQTLFLDVVLFLVNHGIPDDYLLRQHDVAFLERADGLVDRFFHRGREHEQVALQIVEVSFQVFRHESHLPFLPPDSGEPNRSQGQS